MNLSRLLLELSLCNWETNHDLVTDSDSGDEHAGMLLSDVQSDASSMEGDVESDDFLT